MTDGARTHDHRNHNPGLYQLSYNHHNNLGTLHVLVRPAGLEPATLGLEGRCSIRLSYGRSYRISRTARLCQISPQIKTCGMLVGEEGFEPPTSCSQSRRATRLRYTPKHRITEKRSASPARHGMIRCASQAVKHQHALIKAP